MGEWGLSPFAASIRTSHWRVPRRHPSRNRRGLNTIQTMNVDIFDSVARHGWVSVPWNANESLHALVDVLNVNTSYCEMVPAEQTTALVAKCQDTARPGSRSALGGLTAFPPHTDGASNRKPPFLISLLVLAGHRCVQREAVAGRRRWRGRLHRDSGCAWDVQAQRVAPSNRAKRDTVAHCRALDRCERLIMGPFEVQAGLSNLVL